MRIVRLNLPAMAWPIACSSALAKLRAVREIRERILVGELEDALFAVRDAAAHVIQARGEHADFVAALHLHRFGVIALLDARGGRSPASRAGA